tara:strand:+ start:11095 stop:11682 length:588 start_codon:yes stop_codon:yes gene_type:complete
MDLEIRKFVKSVDKTFIEGGKKAEKPVELISVAVVITNPWIEKGFVEDLKPKILEFAPPLGDFLVKELIKEIGSGDKVLAYGKAAVVGLKGEIEHASAFIHTLRFGNKFRDAVGGTSYLSFTNTRGPAGCVISIPMMHKTDTGLRPYYLTQEFTIQDAPIDNEIVIAIGAATSCRAHPRTGDRYQDMEEMKNEIS